MHHQMTRREFARKAAETSAASVALSAHVGHATGAKRRIPYIDIHTHLGTLNWGKPLTPDELVRMMDKHPPIFLSESFFQSTSPSRVG